MTTSINDHPMLAAWTLPPFDKIAVKDIKPALLRGMELMRAEIAAIVADKAAPTFDNTIAALEEAGRGYKRAQIDLRRLDVDDERQGDAEGRGRRWRRSSPPSSDEIIAERAAVRAHQGGLRRAQDGASSTPEQQRLVETRLRAASRAAAPRSTQGDEGAPQARSTSGSRRSTPTFSQNELADEESYALPLDERGRPRRAARQRARRRRRPPPRPRASTGKWVDHQHALVDGAVPHLLDAPRPAREGLAHVRQPRRQRRRARQQAGHHRDPASCAPSARKLLGFPTPRALDHRRQHGQDARRGDGADDEGVDGGGRARARRGRRHAGGRRRREGRSDKIAPWDYRYYAEKVRKAKYDLDENEVKPYLQLDKLREAMFWAAGQLYGFAFTPVDGRAGLPPRRDASTRCTQRRQARRPLVLRPVRARRQALGRVDERVPHAGAVQGRRSRRSSPTTPTS